MLFRMLAGVLLFLLLSTIFLGLKLEFSHEVELYDEVIYYIYTALRLLCC